MKGRVLGKRVVIRQLDAEEQTASGLFIAPVGQEPPAKGEILLVGPDITSMAVGELVFFRKYSGSPLELEEEGAVLVLEEADVLFVE